MNIITVRTKGVPYDESMKHTVDDDGTVTFHIDGDKVDPFVLLERISRKMFSVDDVDRKQCDAMNRRYDEIMERRVHDMRGVHKPKTKPRPKPRPK